MFGTNDNNQQSNDDPAMLDNVKQLVNDPTYQTAQPQAPSQFMVSSAQQPLQSVPPAPIADDSQNHTVIAEPAQGFSSSPLPEPPAFSTSPSATPAFDQQADDDQMLDVTPQNNDTADSAPFSPINTDHLAGMKQQALDQLEPLIGHLDQSPEESFKTTMMMIQANDNHMLLEKALEQAKLISDDKERANAMLDIINEINYFSQSSQE
jgi:hypothetical protein